MHATNGAPNGQIRESMSAYLQHHPDLKYAFFGGKTQFDSMVAQA